MRNADVRYAWNGDAALAYQVFGDGPVDLVYLQGYTSHLDLNWASPYLAKFLNRLGSMARVVHTDRRGWGCSERFSPGDVAPLEVQVDDLVAVMDAVGSERAIVFASMDTVPAAVLFAASRPDRTAGLVLVDPLVAFYDSEESRREWDAVNARVRREWGTPAWDHLAPTGDEQEFREWFVPWCRGSVAPGALAMESDAFGSIDVECCLPSVQVPTLVVGRADRADDDAVKLLAARIADARLIQPLGDDVGPFHWYGRSSAVLQSVGELIAGIRDEQETLDRVLTTVMFTDIVDSAQTAAGLGDHHWAEVINQHHTTVRGLLARYRGREVDTAGDGFFATFDGPARAVRCATAIAAAVRPFGIQVRAGVHTGEVELVAGKLGGIAVVIGARIGAMAGPSEVLTSQTVKDLTTGSGISFDDAGEHHLKGVPGQWHLYRAVA